AWRSCSHPLRQRTGVRGQGRAGMDRGGRRQDRLHRAGQSLGERLHRELQRAPSRRAPRRRNLLLAQRGPNCHRERAAPLQHDQAARLTWIQATSTGGVRARLRRVADCATPSGSAGHAGETANFKLTFHLDHSAGADHYACGSRWDTPFWQYARRGIERARNSVLARAHLADMEEFMEAGRALPGLSLSTYGDQERWDREVYPLLSLYRPFGNFSELNFAQIGHGIGFYGAHTPGRPAKSA